MKIKEKFSQINSKKSPAIIAYFTAGFPNLKKSMEIFRDLDRKGADFIEVGIPFSDPIADGPTIQLSSTIALQRGTTLIKVLEAFSNEKFSVPLIIMSYLNPILAYGEKNFFKDAKKAGFSGIIIPDLPIHEAGKFINLSEKSELDLIFLIAPNTPDERINLIARHSKSFIYCVSVLGTTGARQNLPVYIEDFIKKVREKTSLPLALGFGISSIWQFEKLKGLVDAVVIGSKLIEIFREGGDPADFIKTLKEA